MGERTVERLRRLVNTYFRGGGRGLVGGHRRFPLGGSCGCWCGCGSRSCARRRRPCGCRTSARTSARARAGGARADAAHQPVLGRISGRCRRRLLAVHHTRPGEFGVKPLVGGGCRTYACGCGRGTHGDARVRRRRSGCPACCRRCRGRGLLRRRGRCGFCGCCGCCCCCCCCRCCCRRRLVRGDPAGVRVPPGPEHAPQQDLAQVGYWSRQKHMRGEFFRAKRTATAKQGKPTFGVVGVRVGWEQVELGRVLVDAEAGLVLELERQRLHGSRHHGCAQQ